MKPPNCETSLPNFVVGDEAFPLKQYLLRLYPGKNLTFERKVLNYRLSRARRIIENTFGIMSTRWRLLMRAICANEGNIIHFIRAICVLHDFLMKKDFTQSATMAYCPPRYTDVENEDSSITEGQWRDVYKNETGLQPAFNRSSQAAQDVNNEGRVPWQEVVVNRGLRP